MCSRRFPGATCAAACLFLTAIAAPLAPVRLSKTYFTRGGKPFIPLGAHWIPARAALQWPQEWRASEVESDFRKMQELGFNTVRLDLFWAWFEPRPGDYNPEAFAQFDALVGLAEKYGIYLHPTLFIGGEVGDAFWDVPWRNGRHPHSDSEMLRLQTNHAAELARRYRDTTAILAWDLSDEPPYWIVRSSTTDAMAINWTRLVAGAIRRFDPNHLVCAGTDVQDIGHGPFRPDNIRDEVNFFSVHPYPIYNASLFPDSLLSERITYAAAFQTALSGGAGRPVMVQEFGASSAQYAPERIRLYERANLYSSLGAGANGFLLWCFTDAAPDTWARVPYLRAPHETQFGLTTWDGRDRPRAVEFRRFQKAIAQMDLDGVAPAQAEAGILVPYEWSKPAGDYSKFGLRGPSAIPYTPSVEDGADTSEPAAFLAGSWLSAYVCARRAGLKAEFPREHEDWQRYPIAILPAPLTNSSPNLSHVYTTFWREARKYVEKGGVLYASLSGDSSNPDLEALFGVRLLDHAPAGAVELRVVAPFGNLKPGQILHYQSPGGGPRAWAAVLEMQRRHRDRHRRRRPPRAGCERARQGPDARVRLPPGVLYRRGAFGLRRRRGDAQDLPRAVGNERSPAAVLDRSSVGGGLRPARRLARLRRSGESRRAGARSDRDQFAGPEVRAAHRLRGRRQPPHRRQPVQDCARTL